MDSATLEITQDKVILHVSDRPRIELPIPDEQRVRDRVQKFADANTGHPDFVRGAYAMGLLILPNTAVDSPAVKTESPAEPTAAVLPMATAPESAPADPPPAAA